MNFHHLSLTRKLTIAFSILVAIIIGVSTLSVVSLSESQRDFDSFVSDEFSRGGLARDVHAAASARAIAARNLIILNSPEDIQAETTAVKAAHDRVQERLGMLKKAVASTPGVSSEERALLDKIGHNYSAMSDSGYAWPVIDLQLRYVRGAVFGQKLNVRANLVEWENRLKINYLISDMETGERLTRAVSVQVAVSMHNREMQLASPKVFTDAVERMLA